MFSLRNLPLTLPYVLLQPSETTTFFWSQRIFRPDRNPELFFKTDQLPDGIFQIAKVTLQLVFELNTTLSIYGY